MKFYLITSPDGVDLKLLTKEDGYSPSGSYPNWPDETEVIIKCGCPVFVPDCTIVEITEENFVARGGK